MRLIMLHTNKKTLAYVKMDTILVILDVKHLL